MKNEESILTESIAPKTAVSTDNGITLQAYNEACLDKSWTWLNDSEIRELTMTPVFTREDQIKFFEQLSHRVDYCIWSVFLDGTEMIGAAGLKNYRGSCAEYWGYIGEKKYWNKGLGRGLIDAVEQKAKQLGFTELDLKVTVANPRAIALYQKVGFVIAPQTSTESCLLMVKRRI